MVTTSPDNLWSPNGTDPYNLTTDLATMQTSVQAALSLLRGDQFYRVGTLAQRDALPANQKFVGLHWRDSASKLTFEWNGSAWVNTKDVINLGRISPITTGSQGGIGGGRTDINGMSLTFTLPTASICRFYATVGTYAGDQGAVVLELTNGTISIDKTRISNSSPVNVATTHLHDLVYDVNVPAGTHTFKMRAARAVGSATLTLIPQGAAPHTFSVDRIG